MTQLQHTERFNVLDRTNMQELKEEAGIKGQAPQLKGAGEYELSNREVIDFGGATSYESTLNGKVLDLAIREAVIDILPALKDRENAKRS